MERIRSWNDLDIKQEQRQSLYSLEEVIHKLSSLNDKEHGNYDASYEILLCLANEIKNIKTYLNQ